MSVDALAVVMTVVWALVSGWYVSLLAHQYRADETDTHAEPCEAHCESCGHVMAFSDGLPLRTACPTCGIRLPLTWAGSQLAVLAGCLLMLVVFGPRIAVPFLWLIPVLVLCATIDLRTFMIPSRIVWTGLAIGAALILVTATAVGNAGSMVSAVIGGVVFFGFLFVSHWIYPAGMGFGDVRLGALLGLYLGWVDLRLTLYGLMIGCIFGVVSGLPARLRAGKPGAIFPFGPSLALGACCALWLYQPLVVTGR